MKYLRSLSTRFTRAGQTVTILLSGVVLILGMTSSVRSVPPPPTTITVNSTADPMGFDPNITPSGLGSTVTLRDAIDAANNDLSAVYQIAFAIPTDGSDPGYDAGTGISTITLSQGQISIATSLSINGPSASPMVISGGSASRIFYIAQGETVTLDRLTLTQGSDDVGGAIQNHGTLTLTNSTLSQNACTVVGSALTNYATLTVVNSTFSQNTNSVAMNDGAAVYCEDGASSFTFVTISGNTASNVGFAAGLDISGGSASLTNAILYGNAGGSGDIGLRNGASLGGSHNVIGSGTTTGLTGTISGDPKLLSLAHNGGPTQTMALQPGSSAVRAGVLVVNVDTDQRGSPRDLLQAGGLEGYYYNHLEPGGTGPFTIDPITELESFTPAVIKLTPRIDFGLGTEITPGDGSVLDRDGDDGSGDIFGGLGVNLGQTSNVAGLWQGFIAASTEADYAFTTRSDDGSVLYVDDQLVVNNNNYQGMTNVTGTIHLTAGLHPILVGYFQGGGGYGMQMSWDAGTGLPASRQIIPPSVLYAGSPSTTPDIGAYEATKPPVPSVVNSTITVANSDSPFDLATAFGIVPTGGVFMGTGVNAGQFDPSVGNGMYTITYTVTNADGFTTTITLTINVVNAEVAGPVVTTTKDVVSNVDNLTSLREALTYAGAHAGTTITFNIPTSDPGYDPVNKNWTITLNGTALTIASSVTIQGPGASKLVVNGNDASRVFEIAPGAYTVNISGLTITEGVTSAPSPDGGFGGGLLNNSTAPVTLTDCVFTHDYGNGGNFGGGAGVASFGPITLLRCEIDNCQLIGGNEASGGGFFNAGTGSQLLDSTVVSNSASGHAGFSGGGGVGNGGSLIVSGSTIAGNTVGLGNVEGAGLLNNGGTLIVFHSTVSGNFINAAPNQLMGGAGIASNSDGTLRVISSTVTGNYMDGHGSTSLGGAGIYFDNTGSATVRNTVVAGNNDYSQQIFPDVSGTFTSGGHNLIGWVRAGNPGFTDGQNGDQVGSDQEGNGPLDPMLSGLANNGGPTATQEPASGSPLIDKASDVNTLAANIMPADTSFATNEFAPYPSGVGYVIQIESEQMTVLTNNGTNLTVTRGANGTTMAMHTAGVAVNPAYDQRGSNYPRALDGHLAGNNPVPDVGAVEFLSPPTITVPPGGITTTANGGTINLGTTVSPVVPSGGFFSGPGVDPNTGLFDPTLVGPGTYTITYSYKVGDTTASTTFTITVTALAGPLIVTNINDDGAGSLRRCARDIADGGTVQFSTSTVGGAVNFSTGTHTINVSVANGAIGVRSNATIQGPGQTHVTVSGQQLTRVFWINGGLDVNMDGLTISNGKAVADPNLNGSAYGGGIYVMSTTTLTMTNSTISNNTADGGMTASAYGGGIYVNSYSTDDDLITLTNCTLSGNTASGAYAEGGAIDCYAPLTVNNCSVSGNSAVAAATGYQAEGGGIFADAYDSTTATPLLNLINSTISGNSATSAYFGYGGGVCSDSYPVSITGSTFSNNTIAATANNSGGEGGGLFLDDGGFVGTTTFSANGQTNPNTKKTYGSGGALFSEDDTYLVGCTFTNNYLQGQYDLEGGAVYMEGDTTVSDCSFTGNFLDGSTTPSSLSGYDNQGGAIYVDDPAIFSGCQFNGNYIVSAAMPDGSYTDNEGGAIYNNDAPGFDSCTFNGNYIQSGANNYNYGGAIYNDETASYTNCQLTNNYIQAGASTYNYGGAIYCNDDATLVSCAITGNSIASGANSTNYGGGIYNDDYSLLSASELSGNTITAGTGSASYGGGWADNDRGYFYNSTVANNSISGGATAQGGGFYSDSTMYIFNSTIAGNSVGGTDNISGSSGGGGYFLSNSGAVYLKSTIIAKNTSAGGNPDFASQDMNSFITTLGYNLIGDITGTVIAAAPGDLLGSAPPNNIDPKLGPLQNNGGPTHTMALLTGSPAIDQGNSTINTLSSSMDFQSTSISLANSDRFPNDGPFLFQIDTELMIWQNNGTLTRGALGTLPTFHLQGAAVATPYDQRSAGFPRVFGSQADIGAFEVQSNTPPAVVSIDRADASPTNAATVHFTAVFSKSVTGVDQTDFALANTGLTNPSITSVSGSGTTYTVTVGTGTGSGSLGLNLVDDDTIKDGQGNPLGGTGTHNGDFTGQVYTIDRTAPVVSIAEAAGQNDPTNSATINFTVTSNEPLADFSSAVVLSGTAGATTAVVSGTASPYNVAVSGMTGAGTVIATLPAGSVADTTGNPTTSPSSATVNFDNSPLTVTVEQKAGQADPTNASPIHFTAVFNKSVPDFLPANVTIGGSANPAHVDVSGSGTTYDIAVSGMTASSGTVTAAINAGAVSDAAGNLNANSTSIDNTVTYDTSAFTVTVNQATGQADPTKDSPIHFTAIFNKPTTNFLTGDVTLSGGAGATTATVNDSGDHMTYDLVVTGMTTTGSVKAMVGAAKATDAAGNSNQASTFTDNTVTYDIAPPSVTINQAAGQADPTNDASAINFTVVFSEPVTDFGDGDVNVTGTANIASAMTHVTSTGGNTYNVAVTGITTPGTVIAQVPANVAHDAAGNQNTASTSTDNTVTFDNVPPTVTVNQASTQADPTNATTIHFAAVFSKTVTGFVNAGAAVGGTAGATSALVTGSGTTYDIAVTGMTQPGTVTADILAQAAKDAAGNKSAPSTSTDNTVNFDNTPLSVTINQSISQADPTNGSPIHFTAVFSKATTNFVTGDVTLSGTAGATAAMVTDSGDHMTYSIAVSSMSGSGTVVASIGAGRASDAAGNLNQASTSTDNSVTYDITPPSVTINQASGQADPTNGSIIHFTAVFSKPVANFTNGGVTFSGAGATTAAVVDSGDHKTFDVAISGMNAPGAVTASIAAGVATDAVGNGNTQSTSTDNSVTFDNVSPTVTINQAAGQADPTSVAPVNFTVVFSEPVVGFTGVTVDLSSSTTGGTLSATVTGGPSTYNVAVGGMTTSGNVVAKISSGVVSDAAGNPNAGSTSTDNSVGWIFKTSPAITGALSATTVTTGQSVMDTATLSGGMTPGGTITFMAYGPNDTGCSSLAIFTSIVNVSGNGAYTSAAFTPSAVGTYHFVATYSGDTNNNGVATVCGNTAETLTAQSATPKHTVSGSGTIFTHNNQATFSLNITNTTGRKNRLSGSLSYDDPAGSMNLTSTAITALVFTGNHAHITGKGTMSKPTGKGKTRVTFSVDVTDNGTPGTNDTFQIQVSTGYSASGNLTSGNITEN